MCKSKIDDNYFKKQMIDIKRELLEPLREYQHLNEKIHEEACTDRNSYERDYTRVLYSSSFRRLQGKMQLLAIKNDQFFRNRLTHSLEVAQIARSIAIEIGYDIDELYVVEAGALAHDIGNPPFGHYGEKILMSLAKDFGGYEGNAQTFKILTEIDKKAGQRHGLNLTRRTILSILKYFNKYENTNNDDKPKFIYDESYEIVEEIKQITKVNLRTLDVQIVDVSDEIAYAAHDLEDGLSQGFFTIEEILFAFKKYIKDDENKKFALEKFEKIIAEAKQFAIEAKSTSEYSSMFYNKISSLITYYLIRDLGLVTINDNERKKTKTEHEKELNFCTLRSLAEGLKIITFECVSHTDKVYYYEQAGKKIIESLFALYYDTPKYLPEEYRISDLDDYLKIREKENKKEHKIKNTKERNNELKRQIIDYISGMMDSYAISQYEKFFGTEALHGFYNVSEHHNHKVYRDILIGENEHE